MGRLPDNYFGPKQRIEMLKKEHPGTKSTILTSATTIVVGDTLCLLMKATIGIDGISVAEGHAFTDEPEEAKAVEKAETIAIGRALVNAGYPETLDDDEDQEPKKAPSPSGKTTKLGLGAGKKAVEADDAESEEEEKPAKKAGGLGSRLGAKVKAEDPADDDDDDSEEAEDDDEDDDTEDAEETPAAKPAGGKLSREELLKKYSKKAS